ncbi:D-2-hydroxyacid dehydrogenase [Lapidilactobacillus mulanensis]|uniref:D-2-hydroxyacid dehydrogenase n=1 Tax=Lapidilactobacillus mulanensis TaxID=2485999 RepID=A0ABW4DPN3_9LACO|nr:D-2-hydroxyacid dehydrogenase [Lapidilactobacillus mulanensis]
MPILINLIPLNPTLISKIKTQAPQYQFVDLAEKDFTAADLAEAEIILGWSSKISEALKISHKIKWIQVWFAGVDRLPLKELADAKVSVTTSRGVSAPAIAQQVFGFLLMQSRSLQTSVLAQARSEWQIPDQLTELNDKTVLTLGTGEIARAVAHYAAAFDMQVIGVNTRGTSEAEFQTVYKMSAIDQALKQADVVVNTLPLTHATKGIVDANFFAQMKSSATYINVGRGKTTNERDLIAALQAQQIAFAGLDVFESEPLATNSPLWQMPNVLITPHSAGHTNHYNARIVAIFLKNFAAMQAGQGLVENLVDYQREY